MEVKLPDFDKATVNDIIRLRKAGNTTLEKAIKQEAIFAFCCPKLYKLEAFIREAINMPSAGMFSALREEIATPLQNQQLSP